MFSFIEILKIYIFYFFKFQKPLNQRLVKSIKNPIFYLERVGRKNYLCPPREKIICINYYCGGAFKIILKLFFKIFV